MSNVNGKRALIREKKTCLSVVLLVSHLFIGSRWFYLCTKLLHVNKFLEKISGPDFGFNHKVNSCNRIPFFDEYSLKELYRGVATSSIKCKFRIVICNVNQGDNIFFFSSKRQKVKKNTQREAGPQQH